MGFLVGENQASTNRSRHLEELARFLKIADYLENTAGALSDFAKSQGKPLSTLMAGVKRLEERYEEVVGKPVLLIDRRPGTVGENRLTADGRELHTKILQFLGDVPQAPLNPRLRVAFSHSLISSEVISDVLKKFKEAKPNVVLDVRIETEINFGQVIGDLKAGVLDVAITWDLPGRQKGTSGVQRITKLEGVKGAVLLITHDFDLLDNFKAKNKGVSNPTLYDLECFEDKRLVAVGAESQPFRELLPLTSSSGGERVEVGTLDAITECVRTKVGDYGIVPEDCGKIALYKEADELDSFKIGELGLAVFQASPLEAESQTAADALFEILSESLRKRWCKLPNIKPMGCKGFPDPNTNPTFYQNLKFGYYVDYHRPNEQSKARSPQWRWETIQIASCEMAELGLVLNGRLKNHLGHTFVFKGTLRNHEHINKAGNIFVVEADRVSGTSIGDEQSVDAFVSVFTFCDSANGVLFGSWSGLDPKQTPAVCSTIWSHKNLSFDEVVEHARRVALKAAINVKAGEENFVNQPKNPSKWFQADSD